MSGSGTGPRPRRRAPAWGWPSPSGWWRRWAAPSPAAARAIRALPDAKQASVPIIAVTANAFEEDKQAALDAGMNGHIPKPIDVNLLRRQLGACLNERT